MLDIVYTAVMPAVVAMKVCLPVCDSVVAWSSGLVVIYYSTMVEGESRDISGNYRFSYLTMPHRILYYANIVKGESRGKAGKRSFTVLIYAEPHPILCKYSD